MLLHLRSFLNFVLNNLNGADLMSEGIIFKILETPLMVLLLNALLLGNTFTRIILALFLTFGGRKYWQTEGGVSVVSALCMNVTPEYVIKSLASRKLHLSRM